MTILYLCKEVQDFLFIDYFFYDTINSPQYCKIAY